MRIAVIADIHDNLANLKTCLTWCRDNEIEKIICAGDITNLETITFLAGNFPGEIFVALGNADNYKVADLKTWKNIIYSGEIGFHEIANLKIAVCHEPEKIKEANETGQDAPDFIFYGHTHKPWIEKDGQTIIANPGTLGGVFYPATFAILETTNKHLELKRLAEI